MLKRRGIVSFLAAAALVAGCTGVTVTGEPMTTRPLSAPGAAGSLPVVPAAATPTAAAAAHVPAFSHIYLLILENQDYSGLVGNPAAPYINGLIAKYGLATNYFAVAHPSQPNYLALFSGSVQGITDDAVHEISAPNLADQLDKAGKTWMVYEQSYPGGCFTGATSNGNVDSFGTPGPYARKHDPAISFVDIASNPSRCKHIASLSGFDPAAADFELIVPNECNDMHSCSVATGDAFLSTFVPHVLSSNAFSNSVLFITTDEGRSSGGGGGQVATIVISPSVKAGFTSSVAHDHYSLLRTIEDAWGLPCLGQACGANNLREFFGTSGS